MTRALSALLLATFCVLAGCESYLRYPKRYEYPLRKDLVVKGTPTKDAPDILPSPGDQDKAILAALTKEAGDKALSSVALEPSKLTDDEKRDIRAALKHQFGTPRLPQVAASNDGLGLLPADLYAGSELYRKHCMHCHGVAGDGRGPTGPYVHPHPRDYRNGSFKFISTDNSKTQNYKPRRDDLYRTLDKGIDGTSMPAFGSNLSATEIDQLVSYVIHLSIRGEVEKALLTFLLDKKGPNRSATPAEEIAKEADRSAKEVFGEWSKATRFPPKSPPAGSYPEAYAKDPKAKEVSIERGHALFLDKDKGGCIACHSDYGRRSAYKYDEWGTLVRPANLTNHAYRGGRRPIDFYWRISVGIPPSQMAGKNLTTEETWDLVNFVQALPYPQMLPDKVRAKVYGDSEKILKPDETPKKPH